MFEHGTFGIRIGTGLTLDEVRNVHYWIRTTGKRSRKGIDGGRIDLLRLTINGEMTAWFSSGQWGIPVSDPHSQKALDKLLKRYN